MKGIKDVLISTKGRVEGRGDNKYE